MGEIRSKEGKEQRRGESIKRKAERVLLPVASLDRSRSSFWGSVDHWHLPQTSDGMPLASTLNVLIAFGGCDWLP